MTARSPHLVFVPGLAHRGSFRRTDRVVAGRGRDKCRRSRATRHYECDRPGSPRNGAQPICTVRPLDGRLHRFRDGAPGARPYRAPRSAGYFGALRHPRADRASPQANSMAQTGEFKSVRDTLWPLFVHPAWHDNVALKRAVFKMMDDTGPETFVRQQKAIMSRPDSRPSLGAIQCPTLVLVGNEDALTPVSVALTIADGIAGSKLEIVQDCGHLSTMERPDAVTEALRAWIDL